MVSLIRAGALVGAGGAPRFSPARLFSQNEVGAWYDPSDLTTLFQDAAGTTPVTAPGQVVGRINDKSGRGNHATQSGATSVRPIYAVEPTTGRRNLLTFTEDLTNAAWVKASVTASGTQTATYAGSLGLPNNRYIESRPTIAGGTANKTFTFSARVSGSGKIRLKNTQSGVADNFSANITLTATPTLVSFTVTNGASAGTGVQAGGFAASSDDVAFTLTATDIQFEEGSTATAYQRVVSQYDVTESGVASRHYLAFDGVDDWLQTSTITPGVDKAQVFAGVRKLSDAAGGVVCDLNGATATGAIMLRAPVGASATYGFYSGGSITFAGAITPGTFAAPLTSVLTGIGDIAADTQIIRVNGAQAATSAADQGTGNYSALPLYVGRRQGAALPFNGNLYGLVVRFGANLSAAQISNAERWMGRKTGVTI